VTIDLWADQKHVRNISMAVNTIAGIVPDFWLDAGSLVGLKAGGQVGEWLDKSGNGGVAIAVGKLLNFDPGHGIFQNNPPTYFGPSNEIGGKPHVAFDSARRQTMKLSARDLGLDTSVRGFTFISVARLLPAKNTSYLFITHDRTNSTRFAVIVDPDGKLRVHIRPNSRFPDQVFRAKTDKAFPLAKWGVTSVVVDYRHNTFGVAIYWNSELIGSYRPDSTTSSRPSESGTGSDLSTFVVIGSTGENNHLSCDIAELICFREDINFGTPNNLQLVEDELKAKYKL
jgi:hypothetical protein